MFLYNGSDACLVAGHSVLGSVALHIVQAIPHSTISDEIVATRDDDDKNRNYDPAILERVLLEVIQAGWFCTIPNSHGRVEDLKMSTSLINRPLSVFSKMFAGESQQVGRCYGEVFGQPGYACKVAEGPSDVI